MRAVPLCHWRQGNTVEGYRCMSPIAGPNKPVDRATCLVCAVAGHFGGSPNLVTITPAPAPSIVAAVTPEAVAPVAVAEPTAPVNPIKQAQRRRGKR